MTDTMRERLARTLCVRRLPAVNLTDEARERLIQQGMYQAKVDVDAILRELLDLPAEQWFQIEAELDQDLDRVSFDRALMYILDKGRTVKIPIEGKTSEVERPGDVVA